MNEADGVPHRINQVDRATIGDVDAQADARLVRDQAIAAVEATAGIGRLVYNSDVIAVDLFRRDEWRTSESLLGADLPMHPVEPTERFRFISKHVDTRDTPGERVHHAGQRGQSAESFSRKRTRHCQPGTKSCRAATC
jgi:hypothetical protein